MELFGIALSIPVAFVASLLWYALLPVPGTGDSKIRTTQSLAPRNFLLGAGVVCW
jgi:hypothetical protein